MKCVEYTPALAFQMSGWQMHFAPQSIFFWKKKEGKIMARYEVLFTFAVYMEANSAEEAKDYAFTHFIASEAPYARRYDFWAEEVADDFETSNLIDIT
jgi:hypothetical protein